jgi:beta-glucosidase
VERGNLRLAGLQEELVKNVLDSGKPCIVVLNNGHPLAVEWIAQRADALVEAWEPGMKGGTALAEILYGYVNPSAKLPVTFPRSTGNILSVYNHMPSHYFHPIVMENPMPLYEFGYGLSYTTYAYDNLKTEGFKKGVLHVSVDVTNTGSVAGEEIVLLFMRDDYASMTRPVKELKAFTRVALEPGQTKTVNLQVDKQQLAFWGHDGKWIVEPGTFTVMVDTLFTTAELK